MNNLTGKTYGKLLVLGIDPDHKHDTSGKIVWKCQCECGKILYKTQKSLEAPLKIGVKACSRKCSTSIPLGTRFGNLTVVELVNKPGRALYRCICDCGNETTVQADHLKNGTTKSCGCFRRERMSMLGKENSIPADLKGKRFGKLVAIIPTEKRQGKSIIWKCQCDCGNYHFASNSNLQGGYVTRCQQCQVKSKGEERIIQLLEDNNIPFEREKTFDSCRFPKTNSLLRFDFYVNNEYLIEFDGKQHFQQVDFFNKNYSLLDLQERDSFKNEWCRQNKIPLIRIPYFKLNSLTIKDLKL